MSFSFSIDNFMPRRNGAYAFFALKEHLKSVGWTVPRSSDGTTFNASGDVITQAAAGAGGLDNSLAWFVVRSPDSAHSFCFQRASLGYGGTPLDDSKYWRIKVSVAGFTGGSATQVPAAIDEGLLAGTETDAAPSFFPVFVPYTNQCKSGLYQICAETTAPYQFWACCFGTVDNLGQWTDGLIMMEALVPGTFAPGDVDPFVYCAAASDPEWYAYTRKGLSDETFCVVQPLYGPVMPNHLDVNPITLKDNVIPQTYAADAQNSSGGWKGTSRMVKMPGVDRGMYAPVTVVTPGDYIAVGRPFGRKFLVPWNGSVPDRSV